MADLDRISEIIDAENQALGVFEPKWEKAKENARFYALDPFTQKQKDKLAEQGRDSFNFDKTSHAMNTLLGTQRDGRLEIQFLERTKEDAPQVEVMNQVWKYYSDTNEFIYQESDAFQDGVINDCGVLGMEIDKSKFYGGDLRVFRIPFDQVMWDANSRTYDLQGDEGAQWFSHRVFYRRNELIRRYPKKKDLIERAGRDHQIEPKARPLRDLLWYDPKKELIGTRNFYERGYKTKYLIWEQGQEVPEENYFESKREAEKEIADRLAQFQAMSVMAMAMGQQPQPAPLFEVLPMDCPIVTKSVVMLNGSLEDKTEFGLNEFPYSLYFAYFNDGDYWTPIERYKDPQMFYNRMMMQADHSVGVAAKGVLRIDPRMPKAKKEQVREMWAKTGGIIEASANQIELIEGQGPKPQLFSMADRAENIMDETLGGANQLGLKQTASESGRAVLARQAQAGLDNFVPLDNLRRTKMDLGKKIAWFLSNEITLARKLRITGNSMELQSLIQQGLAEPHPAKRDVAYMEINTTKRNSIGSLEVDVVVGEAQYSPTKMIGALSAMTDAFKSGTVTQPPPPEVAIGLLPIPEEYKKMWLAMFQPKPPEPKIAMNVSYADLPPGGQAQVEQLLGLTPNPQENVVQKVVEALLKQKPQLTPKEKAAGGKNS